MATWKERDKLIKRANMLMDMINEGHASSKPSSSEFPLEGRSNATVKAISTELGKILVEIRKASEELFDA